MVFISESMMGYQRRGEEHRVLRWASMSKQWASEGCKSTRTLDSFCLHLYFYPYWWNTLAKSPWEKPASFLGWKCWCGNTFGPAFQHYCLSGTTVKCFLLGLHSIPEGRLLALCGFLAFPISFFLLSRVHLPYENLHSDLCQNLLVEGSTLNQ